MDDLGDYRPGLDAARQAGVVSPLVDLGFTKQDVREGAAAVGLAIWDKPSAACLSSRIPYGTSVTRERLAQIAGFEAAIKRLGFRQIRVRYHGDLAASSSVTTSSCARPIRRRGRSSSRRVSGSSFGT